MSNMRWMHGIPMKKITTKEPMATLFHRFAVFTMRYGCLSERFACRWAWNMNENHTTVAFRWEFLHKISTGFIATKHTAVRMAPVPSKERLTYSTVLACRSLLVCHIFLTPIHHCSITSNRDWVQIRKIMAFIQVSIWWGG